MRKILSLFVVFSFLFPLAADLQLIKKRSSDYSVAVADPGDEISKLAADELISYLKKSTGCELSRNDPKKKRIVIGIDAKRKENLKEDLPVHNEVRIETVGQDLYLYGGGTFGNMYAVSSFLEKIVGVRWFSPFPGGTYIPCREEIVFKEQNLREKPGFQVRTIPNWYIHSKNKELFYLHNKINNNAEFPRYSDVRQRYAQCHTLFSYIRPEKSSRIWELKWNDEKERDKVYFKTNPEYFSMNAFGKRVPNQQLCFSNPEMRKEFLRRLEIQFKNQGAGVYSISAMDWPGEFCHCKGCRKLVKRYSCKGGPLYDFLLEAAETAKKYPGVFISTLAYRKGQSENPPVMQKKFPDNVIIIFAPVDDDVTKTFLHRNNQGSYENLKKWTKLAKQVWVWYYVYHDSMEGITERLAIDTRMLQEAGAAGTFYEYKFIYAFTGIATDEMTIYIAMKLFWDPKSDWKKHRKDYCRYHYGSVSDQVIAWMDEREAYTRNIPYHLLWSASSTEWGYYKDPANILKEEKLIESWLKATESDPFAHENIKRFRIAVDRELLKYYPKVLKIAPEYKGLSGKIYQRMIDDTKSLAKTRKLNWQSVYRYFIKPLEKKLMIAEVEPKPLPEEFNPADRKVARFFTFSRNGIEKKMSDAAWGYAYGKEVKEPAKGMPFGYYDIIGKRQKNSILPFEKIQKNGFHFYPVVTTALSPYSRVWCHPSWSLGREDIGELFNIDFPDRTWDIYVSLKFTGPAYQEKPETEKNYVWLDQIVLIENKKTQKSSQRKGRK